MTVSRRGFLKGTMATIGAAMLPRVKVPKVEAAPQFSGQDVTIEVDGPLESLAEEWEGVDDGEYDEPELPEILAIEARYNAATVSADGNGPESSIFIDGKQYRLLWWSFSRDEIACPHRWDGHASVFANLRMSTVGKRVEVRFYSRRDEAAAALIGYAYLTWLSLDIDTPWQSEIELTGDGEMTTVIF